VRKGVPVPRVGSWYAAVAYGLICLAIAAPARASDLRGTYVSSWPAEVAQLRVFGEPGALRGEFDSVAADRSQSGGVRRIRIPVKIFANGERVTFVLRRPFLATEQRWTAQPQQNGNLVVEVAERAGKSDAVTFYLVDPARAQRIKAGLLETAARDKQLFDATDRYQLALMRAANELARAQRSLEKNRELRRAGAARLHAATTPSERSSAKVALRARDARIAALERIVDRNRSILARRTTGEASQPSAHSGSVAGTR
jgi:hypothetical protein